MVSASDQAFRYQGRLDLTDPAAPVVVWESSRISVDFKGASLSLLFGPATGQNFFDAKVDGEARIIAVEPGPRGKIAWPGSLGPGLHHLVLVKRTEASAGSAAFRGIEIEPDATVERPVAGRAPLRILFLGDSITAGACDEDGAVDQWDDRRTHNAEMSYATLTADAFGADYENISVSGIGIVTGYVDVTFGEIWDRLYPVHGAPKADLTAWRPAVIFLNLGGNDTSFSKSKGRPFPASFADSYFKLVTEVRSAYPDAELVLLRGGMSETETDPVLIAAWTDAVRRFEAQDRHTTHFVFVHHTDLHPRAADHRMMADELCQWLRGQPFMSPFRAAVAHGQDSSEDLGPTAALKFALSYRGQNYVPNELYCYPDAQGIPFSDTRNIIPMSGSLWTPAELAADFRQRMAGVPENDRKRGIIVMLKTERCCTKEFRACTVTTAALEKRASPLVAEFLVYGAWIMPRDGDKPPGSLRIEKGSDGWKNDAAGTYGFEQGPGATLAFINPADGSILERTDALRMGLYEKEFIANQGRAPELDEKLGEVLRLLKPPVLSRGRTLGIPALGIVVGVP